MSSALPTTPAAAWPGRGLLPGDWSLRRRLTWAVAVMTVLLLAVVATSAVLLAQVRAGQRLVGQRYFEAIQLSDRQFIALVDAETAIRGYALTHDQSTLAPMAGLASAGGDVDRIQADLDGDRTTLAALDVARGAARRWYEQWAAPTVATLQGGGTLTSDDVLAGKALFDRVRVEFRTYLTALVAQRDAARVELSRQTSLLFSATVVSALASLACALVLWLLLGRWVLRPVARLAASTRVVRGGALDRPVVGTGPREVRELAADVDTMRQRLVGEVEAARSTSEALRVATDELSERSAELARSNRDLEQFAYVASHDLQEPLRKVASFCQLLAKRYGGQLDERADQYIEFAVDGAKRMQQLINDLLTFSRVGRTESDEQGGPRAERPTADLQVCLRKALSSLSMAVEEAGAEVTSDPLPVVAGPAGLHTQLLQNVIGNAVKFRDPQRPPRIHLGATRVPADQPGSGAGAPAGVGAATGARWELSCADNGIGIEPQYAERVFVIFQRLHAKEAYTGTGIGLALCKRIVEHVGGTMWVDTAVPVGTTVRWVLPPPDHDVTAMPLDAVEASP